METPIKKSAATSLGALALLFAVSLMLAPSGLAEPPEWSGKPDAAIVVKTLPGMMRYDTAEIEVEPGAKVKLTLENPDDLQHNLVVLKADAEDKDGQKFAMNVFTRLGEKAIAQGWVPREDPRIIVASQLLDPKGSEDLYFIAPQDPGDYPFVCTVPGHALLMRGVVQVRKKVEILTDLTYSIYKGDWNKLPDFSAEKPVETGKLPQGLIDLEVAKKMKGGFGVVFEGKLKIAKEEEYHFFIASDDGSRLIIDGEGIVEQDGIHPMGNPKEEKLLLQEGIHDLRVVYFDKSGQRGLSVAMRSKSLGFQELSVDKARKKANKAEPKPILINPKNGEAITFRSFFPDVSPRGIAVGYPGGVNLVWDADLMNVAVIWRGGFLNAASQWEGRGSGSRFSGYDHVKTGQGLPMQQLESLDDPWQTLSKAKIKYERDVAEPQKEITFDVRHPDYEFEGYQLDPKNRFPTFNYRYREAKVTESFEPSVLEGREALVRHIAIDGSAAENTWFRISQVQAPEKNDAGWYPLAGSLWMKVEGGGGEPVVRPVGNGNELLVPLDSAAAKSELTVTYWWQTKIGGQVKK
ncbi:MAG: hypothetical protein KDN20_18960 [Verrucomicrobiae bacterium]|nr:hypothetical protein [Verrucomicrobiae bacterium]